MSDKEQILADLVLIKDEPALNLMFGFEQLAMQLFNVITDEKTNTPFAIAVHGEWGSGKTSLINTVYEKTKKLIEKNNVGWKTLKFDAWEYERTDIVVALLQQISNQYDSSNSTNLTKSLSSFILDVMLRKTMGMSKDETIKHFKNFVKCVPSIRKNLEDLTKDNRLIVFVDDLDRCNIGNVLDMLEAIKMFFIAEGVIFIVAVDMDKIERAWRLRYNNNLAGTEGRDHIEKIFQLKLSLPFKQDTAISAFVSNLFPHFLMSEERKKLLVSGCKRNPRNIKRVLNLVYFIILGLPEDENFSQKIDLVILWCVLVSSFPELAKRVKNDPSLLFRTSFACCRFQDLPTLVNCTTTDLGSEMRTRINFTDDESFGAFFDDNVKKQLELVAKNADSELFEFLCVFGQNNGFDDNWNEMNEKLTKYIYDQESFLKGVIRHGGFTGI